MFCLDRQPGKDAVFLEDDAAFRARALRSALPSSRTLPLVGFMKPGHMLIMVVLPQPEGPITATKSPSLMS